MNSNGFSAADMSTAAANGHAEGYQAGYADAVKAYEAGKPAAAPGIDLPGWAFERPDGSDLIVISAPNGRTWVTEPDDRLHMLATAVIDASPKGGSGRGRYFCDGPEGHFFCDDLKLARDLVNAYDKDDDWTITDLQATGAEVGA